MKTFFLLLSLLPAGLQNQSKLLYYNVQTIDQSGKPLPNCNLEIMATGVMGAGKFMTGNQGRLLLPWYINNGAVIITAKKQNYVDQYLMFDKIQTIPDGDTIAVRLVLRPRICPVKKWLVKSGMELHKQNV